MVWFCYELLYKDESTSLREDVQRREKYSADDSITKCGKSNHRHPEKFAFSLFEDQFGGNGKKRLGSSNGRKLHVLHCSWPDWRNSRTCRYLVHKSTRPEYQVWHRWRYKTIQTIDVVSLTLLPQVGAERIFWLSCKPVHKGILGFEIRLCILWRDAEQSIGLAMNWWECTAVLHDLFGRLMHDHVHIRPMPCFPPFVLSSERRVAGERERDFPLSATGSPDSIPISMYLLMYNNIQVP
ncbi:hypothetical protein Bca4012_094514 [Brassica carinata]